MSDHGLVDLAVCVGAGWLLGLAAHWLRQPVLLGVSSGGSSCRPQRARVGRQSRPALSNIAELGLVLLLFLLGLEMDFKKLRGMGRLVLTTAVAQVLGSTGIAFGLFWLLERWLGVTPLGTFYLAVAAALSSTIIGIKLLHDKRELGTLAGQITLGVLVFQDLAAILFVGIQPTLLDPSLPVLVATLGKVALLVGLALLVSRYVLPAVFAKAALRPELVVLGALAWCFIVVACADARQLSGALGAITAGTAISTFPYALDIEAKVASLRDVFVTLFFVTVGLTLPPPDLAMVVTGLIICVVVVLTRFVTVFAPVYWTGGGCRAGFLASINLIPICELSLVLVALGVSLGHLQPGTSGKIVFAFAVMAFAGTYAINYSDRLYRWGRPLMQRLGLKERASDDAEGPKEHGTDIFVLGFFQVASSLFEELHRTDPAVLARLTVVDFNPVTHPQLRAKGIRTLYGDISQRATLERAGLPHARLVLLTLSGWILKGITPERLVRNVRALNPAARIVAVGDTIEEAHQLRAAGADLVLLPRLLLANEVMAAIRAFDGGLLEEKRAELETAFRDRREILASPKRMPAPVRDGLPRVNPA